MAVTTTETGTWPEQGQHVQVLSRLCMVTDISASTLLPDRLAGFGAPRHLIQTELEAAGAEYDKVRCRIMHGHQERLTHTYNRFYNPGETSTNIQKLCELHLEMDNAVAAAYGWSDLNLDHGFHETKQANRYAFGEPARLFSAMRKTHERR